jgi:tyrosinase
MGFGGNGQFIPVNKSIRAPTMFLAPPVAVANRSGGGCIMTGPFAGLSTQLGAGDNIQKKGQHCVTRDLTYSYLLLGASPANLSWAMTLPDYGWFNNRTEVSYHASGHWSVGGLYGTMTDLWASGKRPKKGRHSERGVVARAVANDKLRVATKPIALDPLFYLHHANVDRAWWSWQSRDLAVREFDISGPLVAEDYDNARAGNLTLDARIHIGVTRELDVAVADVMHIQKRALCYAFDQLY